jgi:hypothetical protein
MRSSFGTIAFSWFKAGSLVELEKDYYYHRTQVKAKEGKPNNILLVPGQ